MDLAHMCGSYCLRSIDLLDPQASFVLVEMFALQPGLLVVGPNECLPAVHVIELVRPLNVIANGLEVGACGELMEGDLIADSPILHREAIVGMPQHCVTDTFVKRLHALFPFDDHRIRTPSYTVHWPIHHHVRRNDLVVLSRAFEVHMPPEI